MLWKIEYLMVRNNFLVSNSGVRLLLRKLRCHLHHHQKLNFPGSNHSTTAVKKHNLITPGGCLTLTSGTAALKPGKGASVGGALNGGVIVLTEGLASDLAESRVRVNVVVPGLEKSELWDKLGKTEEEQKQIFEKADLPVGFVATPDGIAEACLYLAKAKYATGTSVEIGEYLLSILKGF
jgi:NAD(P)-dependent dehydrogenase (short-subunit alcohol dehydrogenase family)